MREIQILTLDGFKNLSEIKVGDIVIDSKGRKTTVKTKRTYKSPTYSLYLSNGTQIDFGKKNFIETIKSEVISKKRIRDKNGKPTEKRDCIYKNIKRNISIEDFYNLFSSTSNNDKVHYPYKLFNCNFKGFKNKLEIDPYLLGLIIGDGGIVGNKKDKRLKDKTNRGNPVYTVDAKIDPDLLKNFTKLVKELGDQVKLIGYGKCCDYRVNNSNLKEKLIKLNLWGKTCYNKFIPSEYLLSTEEDRLAMLQGLMDTDGCCYIRNNEESQIVREFDSTSKTLVEQIGFLTYSLGGKTGSLSKKKCKYKKDNKVIELDHNSYRYDIRLPKHLSAFRCKRKKEIEKLYLKKSYNTPGFEKNIKSIKKSNKINTFTKITLSNGAESFIGNDFIKIHI